MASATTKASSLVICRLYRNLLRTVKPFTAPSPNARVLNSLLHRTGIDDHIGDWEAFVSASPDGGVSREDQARDLTYSYGGGGKEVIPPNRTFQRLFRRLLREVVSGSDSSIRKLSWPSEVDTNKLRAVLQREFRDGPSSQSVKFDPSTRRQVAFTALIELNKKLSYFEELEPSSPEPLPQQAAWNVSALPFSPPSTYLQPGAFLVSHPYMQDSFFSKTVICILEDKDDINDETASKRNEMPDQTYGIIVNRVSVNPDTGKNRTLREAFEEHMLPGRLADVFGDSVVREGGPVHVAIQMLYSLSSSNEDDKLSGIGGKIIPMIPEGDSSTALYSDRATYFQGDVFKAMNAVDGGAMDRDDISFFVGASTWAPGQLEEEIAQGYWIPCRGPPEMALTGICEHGPATSGKRPLADLWLSMMSACGEDEGKLAHLFYHEEWDENGLACDAFGDDDDDDDDEFEIF